MHPMASQISLLIRLYFDIIRSFYLLREISAAPLDIPKNERKHNTRVEDVLLTRGRPGGLPTWSGGQAAQQKYNLLSGTIKNPKSQSLSKEGLIPSLLRFIQNVASPGDFS